MKAQAGPAIKISPKFPGTATRPGDSPAAAAGIFLPAPLTLTRQEFATAFRLSLRTVERMIAAGEIQICHIGPRAVRIPRTEAERYLQGETLNAESPSRWQHHGPIGHQGKAENFTSESRAGNEKDGPAAEPTPNNL